MEKLTDERLQTLDNVAHRREVGVLSIAHEELRQLTTELREYRREGNLLVPKLYDEINRLNKIIDQSLIDWARVIRRLGVVEPVMTAAKAWHSAPHVDNANHAAGQCDECPARVAGKEFWRVFNKALAAEEASHG